MSIVAFLFLIAPYTYASIIPGKWALKSGCTAIANVYVKNYMEYKKDGTFNETSELYHTSECQAKVGTQRLTGTYRIQEKDQIYSTLKSYTLTAENHEEALSYNQVGLCGFTDWQVGVAKSILGQKCQHTHIPNDHVEERAAYQYHAQQKTLSRNNESLMYIRY